MGAFEIILLVLCGINLLVALIILLKSNSRSDSAELEKLKLSMDNLIRSTADEFQRSRNDNIAFQNAMRDSQAALQKQLFDFTSEFNRQTTEYQSRFVKEVSVKLQDAEKANFQHFTDLSKLLANSLENIREKNIEQNEKQAKLVEAAITRMQESNEQKLEAMRLTVDEKLNQTLTTRLDSSFKTVSEQLENVYKSLGEMKELSSGVTDNVTTLNRVLSNVKARGTWAEVQLQSILDQTIPNMYVKNYQSESSRGVVEFAIKIPSGENNSELTYLPVDSKFPLETYIRICDAADKADANALAAARKELESSIYKSAKDITKYINPPKTMPFAIMYLATEGLYAETASISGLLERLQREYNIMVAGPSTITALLNSIAMGFKTIAINEKASEIRKILGAAKVQYDKFGDLLQKARRKIDEAGKSLDEAHHRNTMIQKKLSGVEALDVKEAELLLNVEAEEEPQDEDSF
ncbi:MAG: DNA recombination protein RmuC [Acutalibacteraceae bacterium]|jgi:DNA recombination protein RmuC